jgi:hypothetical protein
MSLASRVYLFLVFASECPELAPAYEHARTRDLLWLLLPVAGLALFPWAVEHRENRDRRQITEVLKSLER